MMRIASIASLLALSLCFSGCSKESTDDLNLWLIAQKKAPVAKPVITPDPVKFIPVAYELGHLVDPFSVRKLVNVLKPDKQTNSNQLLNNELERRKEPLEQYPRESFLFSGSINRSGKPIGLVKLGKQLYYVKVGDYIGQNFGRVVKISESELSIREIVQSGSGDWEERMTIMQLQENSQ
jgi:type IV pilus assembly protein PilP